MDNHAETSPEYGTGHKKLSIYFFGIVGCVLLTLLAFFSVISHAFGRLETFIIIFAAACLQFLVQVICFLRLNTQSEQGKINVMAFIFTGVVLLCIIAGSLWIMWNLHFNMIYPGAK